MCRSTLLPGSYTQGSDAGTLVCTHHAAVPSDPSPRENRAAGEQTECQLQEVSSLSGLVISSTPHYSRRAVSEAPDMEGTKVKSVKKAPPPPPPAVRRPDVPDQAAGESRPGDAPEGTENPGRAVSLPVPAPRRRSSCTVTPVPAPRTRSSQPVAAAGEHCAHVSFTCGQEVAFLLCVVSETCTSCLPLFGSATAGLIFFCTFVAGFLAQAARRARARVRQHQVTCEYKEWLRQKKKNKFLHKTHCYQFKEKVCKNALIRYDSEVNSLHIVYRPGRKHCQTGGFLHTTAAHWVLSAFATKVMKS